MDLKIEKLIYGGDGLAHLRGDEGGRGKAVFVPFTLVGERVEARIVEEKPGFARARIDKILEMSPERIPPFCPYFARCGGCHYQHIGYEHQLAIKTAIFKENLRRIAKLELPSEVQVHASPPWNYRNRTRLRVQTTPKFALGYYRFGSHELLSIENCPISSPLVNRAIAKLWELGSAGKVDAWVRELELFANADDTQLLIEAYGMEDRTKQVPSPRSRHAPGFTQKDQGRGQSEPIRSWAKHLLSAIPEALGVTVFSWTAAQPASKTQPDTLAAVGVGELKYQTEHATYRVSAGSFFQTNRFVTDSLIEFVTRGRSGRTALELYAGVGLFSSVLARTFERVIAVESSPPACADLAYNAPVNVKVVCINVDQYLKHALRKVRPDLVVVDPPRSGLGNRVAHDLAELGAPSLTYVSCDPATLARDLVPLLGGGYRVADAHLVDVFPQTFHLESVLHLVLRG